MALDQKGNSGNGPAMASETKASKNGTAELLKREIVNRQRRLTDARQRPELSG